MWLLTMVVIFFVFSFFAKNKKRFCFFCMKTKKAKNIFILIFQLLHTVQIGVKFQNALKSIFLANLHTTDQVAISTKGILCVKPIQIADLDFFGFVFGPHFLQKRILKKNLCFC